jgi:hypothetical protein
MNAKRRFSKIIDKMVEFKVQSLPIKAGPVLASSTTIAKGDSLITFRPFLSLLSIWLNDSRWLNNGYLPTTPLPLQKDGFRTYSESLQYQEICNRIKNANPHREFFVIPLCFWSDVAQLSQSRQYNSSVHPLIFSCPLASSMMINSPGGMQILGFIGEANLTGSNNSSSGTYIRQQLTAKAIFAMLSEIMRAQDDGGVVIRCFGKN